jgi:hypothetical protein
VTTCPRIFSTCTRRSRPGHYTQTDMRGRPTHLHPDRPLTDLAMRRPRQQSFKPATRGTQETPRSNQRWDVRSPEMQGR